MTDYSKLSDFEINKAVAISQGFAPENCDIAKRGSSLVGVDWDEDTGSATKVFDYCNNPSDSWPILKEYCIDINWDGDSDSNPLRDAMIIYLMMKESENG